MRKVLCLVEHRRGELRNISLEMLSKAQQLAGHLEAEVFSVLLGSTNSEFARQLAGYSNTVLTIDNDKLQVYDQVIYQKTIVSLIKEFDPVLVMIGHTAFGMDLAPSLAVESGLPLATDCIELDVKEGQLIAVRQMYGGKINAIVSFPGASKYMVTVRQGVFPVQQPQMKGEIVTRTLPADTNNTHKLFVSYVEPEVGDVDISQASIVVAVGRGIKKKENLPIVQELADTLGGVLACSRPIVDSEWLSKDRQVGQSGKTVKPKLYLAVGISGAFQHVMGMKGSEMVVVINKDGNAPLFNTADIGIVDDMFNVVPKLSARLKELK